MSVDCYGNNRSNGSAVEDVGGWVQNLAYHPPQGPLQRVSGFDKSQGVADGQHADISNGQIEYVLVNGGFVGAGCACYDYNQDVTHNTNEANDSAQTQTNCFDKLRFQFGTFGHQLGRVRWVDGIVEISHFLSKLSSSC